MTPEKRKTAATPRSSGIDLLIVGDPDPVHVGRHFSFAAESLNLRNDILDVRAAHSGPTWKRRLYWRALGHRPPNLRRFSDSVVAHCQFRRPKRLLATGIAPISANALRMIGDLGVLRLCFLTDDPWNPRLRSNHFLDSLSDYDHVFSPRRSILADLARHGCPATYLPFAYSPEAHFAETERAAEFDSGPDIAFVGAADAERVELIRELPKAGLGIQLYGGFWDRYRSTQPYARGMASPQAVRLIAATAKVSLCLVRRANRDQSCMRTFELAAMGACILAEDTQEHREIYGSEGFVAVYFQNTRELMEKALRLVADPLARKQMRRNTKEWVHRSHHTYKDRLEEILAVTQRDT